MANKILGGILTVFFSFAAIVQFNDPDPWLWVLLYLVAAAASVIFFLERLKIWMVLVLLPIYIILAIIHWPPEFEGVALQEGMKTMNIELARESLGMGISSLILLLYGIIISRRKKS
ncbi:MAG: transmembrane 220 family protein [Bacteroidota bacterium]